MAQLSSQRAEELVNNLNTIGQAMADLRQKGTLSNGQSLTSQQRDYLLNCQIQLLRSSAVLSAQAIALTADSIQDQLDSLQGVAGNIAQVLGRVKDAQKIMDIAGAVAAVVSSVVSGDVLKVSESLGKLIEYISKVA